MKLSLSRIIIVLLAFAGSAFASELELRIDGLEGRIEFWKKVFTEYGEEDVILHDSFHVNLIYDVVSRDNVKSRTALVKQALQEIGENLDTTENLSLTAKQIHESIVRNGIPLSASTIEQLRSNIHTQRGVRERFRQGVIRSGRYVESFREILAKEGIPETIALLPLVESSFENRARSKVGAAGIWQFTRSTGRLYLRVSGKVDERLDPMKATRAAARLLRQNYTALGAWPLAITAYNHGRAGIMRAKSESGPDLTSIINGYRGRRFGYASMNFYAEFVAAVQVYQNYPQYFGELVLEKPTSTPAAPAVSVAERRTTDSNAYRVRNGDTLSEIARRFETTIRELMEKNNLRNATIYAGQILAVK
jgi:membrane-bound lytic murein transglycosylase D